MKRIILLSVIIVSIITSCGKSEINKPEDIGKQVFEILKNINKTTKQDYVNNFVSPQIILNIYEGVDVDSLKKSFLLNNGDEEMWDNKLKEELLKISEKQGQEIEDDYNRIKKRAGEYGINWEEVKYLDFTYEMGTEDYIYNKHLYNRKSPQMCKAQLFLKYEDKPFSVKVKSLLINGKYELYEIGGLYN